MPPVPSFKRRVAQGFVRRSIPSPYQETDDRNLWDDPKAGKPVTFRNVKKDVGNTIQDIGESWWDADFERVLGRARSRVGEYISQGPDIEKPVPLTPNPYKRRRRRAEDDD